MHAGGYSSAKGIEDCLLNGIAPQVGIVYDREERVINLVYHPRQITEGVRRGEMPEDIRACLHAGVLPQCYEGTDTSVELEHEGEISYFLRARMDL